MPAAKRPRDGNQIGIEDLEASHAAGDATSTVPYSGRDFSGMKTRERLSIYRTEVNETPAEIAKKLDIDLPKFLAQNLAFYPSLTRSAKMMAGTYMLYTGGSVDLIEGEVVQDDGYLHKNGFWRVRYKTLPSHLLFDKTSEETRAAVWEWQVHHQGWSRVGPHIGARAIGIFGGAGVIVGCTNGRDREQQLWRFHYDDFDCEPNLSLPCCCCSSGLF